MDAEEREMLNPQQLFDCVCIWSNHTQHREAAPLCDAVCSEGDYLPRRGTGFTCEGLHDA